MVSLPSRNQGDFMPSVVAPGSFGTASRLDADAADEVRVDGIDQRDALPLTTAVDRRIDRDRFGVQCPAHELDASRRPERRTLPHLSRLVGRCALQKNLVRQGVHQALFLAPRRSDPAHRNGGLGAKGAKPPAKLHSVPWRPMEEISRVTAIDFAGCGVLAHHLTVEHNGELVIPEVDFEHAHGVMIRSCGIHHVRAVGRVDELQLEPLVVDAASAAVRDRKPWSEGARAPPARALSASEPST